MNLKIPPYLCERGWVQITEHIVTECVPTSLGTSVLRDATQNAIEQLVEEE